MKHIAVRMLMGACLFLASHLSATTVSQTEYVSSMTGSTLDAKIAAADSVCTSYAAPCLIVVDEAGTITNFVTISKQHSVKFTADVTFSTATNPNVPLLLMGQNTVSCDTSVTITSASSGALALYGDDIDIGGCVFSGDHGGGSFAIVSAGGNKRIHVHNLTLKSTGGLLQYTGDYIRVESVSMFDSDAQVLLSINSDHIQMENILCKTAYHCIQWGNGEADPGKGGAPPDSRGAYANAHGQYTYNNITCDGVVSCVWGSLARNIIISNSSGKGCGDVCFDTEGAIDVLMTGNRCSNPGNACYSTFFYINGVSMIGNEGERDTPGPIIMIKNQTADAGYVSNIVIKNNTLRCFNQLCHAIYAESLRNVTITNNTVNDGIVEFQFKGGDTNISNNELNFSMAGASAFTALGTPNLGAWVDAQVAYNLVRSSVAQPAGSNCIQNTTNEYNGSPAIRFLSNTCLGFPTDIQTTNLGGNAGTTVYTTLVDNYLRENAVIHNHPGSNFDDYKELSRSYMTTVLNASNVNWTRKTFESPLLESATTGGALPDGPDDLETFVIAPGSNVVLPNVTLNGTSTVDGTTPLKRVRLIAYAPLSGSATVTAPSGATLFSLSGTTPVSSISVPVGTSATFVAMRISGLYEWHQVQ